MAIVLDVWSRKVVGWSIGETLHTGLVLKALELASAVRDADGVIGHSDKGCQPAFNRSSQHVFDS